MMEAVFGSEEGLISAEARIRKVKDRDQPKILVFPPDEYLSRSWTVLLALPLRKGFAIHHRMFPRIGIFPLIVLLR